MCESDGESAQRSRAGASGETRTLRGRPARIGARRRVYRICELCGSCYFLLFLAVACACCSAAVSGVWCFASRVRVRKNGGRARARGAAAGAGGVTTNKLMDWAPCRETRASLRMPRTAAEMIFCAAAAFYIDLIRYLCSLLTMDYIDWYRVCGE